MRVVKHIDGNICAACAPRVFDMFAIWPCIGLMGGYRLEDKYPDPLLGKDADKPEE